MHFKLFLDTKKVRPWEWIKFWKWNCFCEERVCYRKSFNEAKDVMFC